LTVDESISIADFFPPNFRVDFYCRFLTSRQIAETISIADFFLPAKLTIRSLTAHARRTAMTMADGTCNHVTCNYFLLPLFGSAYATQQGHIQESVKCQAMSQPMAPLLDLMACAPEELSAWLLAHRFQVGRT
jgi:hypothetical protein